MLPCRSLFSPHHPAGPGTVTSPLWHLRAEVAKDYALLKGKPRPPHPLLLKIQDQSKQCCSPPTHTHLEFSSRNLESQLYQAAHRHANGTGGVHLIPYSVTVHLQGQESRLQRAPCRGRARMGMGTWTVGQAAVVGRKGGARAGRHPPIPTGRCPTHPNAPTRQHGVHLLADGACREEKQLLWKLPQLPGLKKAVSSVTERGQNQVQNRLLQPTPVGRYLSPVLGGTSYFWGRWQGERSMIS